MRSGTHRALVYHWYEGSFGLLAESARSLLAVDRTSWGKTGDMVAIRISTELIGPKDAGRAEAEAVLLDYYRSLRGGLDRLDKFLSGKIFS